MTEDLRSRIMRHEGIVLNPKPDAKGAWVIGYGHDIPESEASNYPNGCTMDEACNWLDADIQKATEQVKSALPWISDLSPIRQDVLIEMAFQLGIHGFLGFHHTLAALKAGDYDATVNGMLSSAWHIQTPERCEELAALMLNND